MRIWTTDPHTGTATPNLPFPYAALFVALSFVTMCFVKHGDARAEAKKGLAAFEDMDS